MVETGEFGLKRIPLVIRIDDVIDNASDGVSAVNGGGTVAEDLDAIHAIHRD